MRWDESNTFNLLKGLYSLGYLDRNGDTFCNMPEMPETTGYTGI